MSNKIDNLDEMLECAIRERAAFERMEELDRLARERHHRVMRFCSFAAAACISAVAVVAGVLRHEARTAGYAFDPAYGQMGGSEITALMQEKQIDEAVCKISDARALLEEEISHISPDEDPDYKLQLSNDLQELDLLEAVCHMRKGNYFKAKKALKAIVAAGGTYSDEAETLLGNM